MTTLSVAEIAAKICTLVGNESWMPRVITAITTIAPQLNLALNLSSDAKEYQLSSELTIPMPIGLERINFIGLIREGVTYPLVDGFVRNPTSGTCDASPAPVIYNLCADSVYQMRVGAVYGNYRTDAKYSVIRFSSDLEEGDKVYMEYTSSEASTMYKCIPEVLFTVIYYRVLELLYAATDPAASSRYRYSFEQEYRTYKRLSSSLTIHHVIDALRSDNSLIK